ncbi:MAG TPA: thiamine phosphate synthase [Burkholderiales bacterium]|nr:thiamine phosphate synthase [Burkholderiales bacterium]
MIAGLYAITPDCGDDLAAKTEAALKGGAKVLQYRNKSGKREMRVEQALELKKLCKIHGVPLIINDDIDLAVEIDADGAHVGSDDLGVGMARKKLKNGILGVSCYGSMTLATEAQRLGADYVAFGSFFPSITKPDAVKASLSLLQMSKLSIKIPVVAIGGITPENGGLLIESGADALAVISSLFDVPDTAAAAKQFSELFYKK